MARFKYNRRRWVSLNSTIEMDVLRQQFSAKSVGGSVCLCVTPSTRCYLVANSGESAMSDTTTGVGEATSDSAPPRSSALVKPFTAWSPCEGESDIFSAVSSGAIEKPHQARYSAALQGLRPRMVGVFCQQSLDEFRAAAQDVQRRASVARTTHALRLSGAILQCFKQPF
jgi:hypothetical protein